MMPASSAAYFSGWRGRQVDLVEHRDDVQVGVQREVEVREGLRLDALRGVDEQDGGLAGLERPRDLVGEVDVPGRVDHVEHVGAGLGALVVAGRHRPRHPDGLALDGDAALALDVHPVEVLRPGAALVDDAGELQHPVGQRRLAVVDVRDDAEVADDRGVGPAREAARSGSWARRTLGCFQASWWRTAILPRWLAPSKSMSIGPGTGRHRDDRESTRAREASP